jgi:hypothetical protein
VENRLRSIFNVAGRIKIHSASVDIVDIDIGDPDKTILNTTISNVSFTPWEQYNAAEAVMAIERSADIRSAEVHLGMHQIGHMTTGLVNPPMQSLPHLSQSMSNLTFDEALNAVARTFGAIVVYGSCRKAGLYDIYVPRQYNYFDNSAQGSR